VWFLTANAVIGLSIFNAQSQILEAYGVDRNSRSLRLVSLPTIQTAFAPEVADFSTAAEYARSS